MLALGREFSMEPQNAVAPFMSRIRSARPSPQTHLGEGPPPLLLDAAPAMRYE